MTSDQLKEGRRLWTLANTATASLPAYQDWESWRDYNAPALLDAAEEAERLREALADLVEIKRRDDTSDPDVTASDEWRAQAWATAAVLAPPEKVKL